jgi:hypothetical protein
VSTWNRFFFGVGNPSVARRVALNILAGAFVCCWFGLRTEFVISEWWLIFGTGVSVLISGALARWFCRLCWDAFGEEMRSRRERSVIYVSAYGMLLVICWVTMVYIAPDLSTRWVATQTTEEALLGKVREVGRSECDYQVYGEHFRFQPAGYICVSGSEFEQLPEHGLMRVRGRRSVFGLHVDRIEPAGAVR